METLKEVATVNAVDETLPFSEHVFGLGDPRPPAIVYERSRPTSLGDKIKIAVKEVVNTLGLGNGN